jgi:hypothetical protein
MPKGKGTYGTTRGRPPSRSKIKRGTKRSRISGMKKGPPPKRTAPKNTTKKKKKGTTTIESGRFKAIRGSKLYMNTP